MSGSTQAWHDEMNRPVQSGARLSVCIPVFNFGGVLGETLDSILPQATADMEVLVVDGASTDDTQVVVARRASVWPQLRYIRLERRGGIDQDLATSVALARGEYCWLFSGDDLMRPGAVGQALQRLRAGHDVYICRHAECGRDMQFVREYPIFADERVRVAELSNPAEREQWLSQARNTEALFSFMGGLIVRRMRWISVEPPEQFVGSCWGHVARLLELARSRLSVCYVAETWLDRRGDNDSFRDKGMVNRLRIAVDGYLAIAGYYYGLDSREVMHVRRLLRNELSIPVFFYARELVMMHPEREDRAELDRLFDACYGATGLRGRLSRVLYRTLPVNLYRVLKVVRRGILASRRRLHNRLRGSRAG